MSVEILPRSTPGPVLSDVEVRAASGNLTGAEISTPITGLERFSLAVLRFNITVLTMDGTDEVDFYIQTSYNGGTDWVDVENLHFGVGDNGDTPKVIVVIAFPQSSAVGRVETDGLLADDTKLDIPLGDRLRIRVKIVDAPTYAYSVEGHFR